MTQKSTLGLYVYSTHLYVFVCIVIVPRMHVEIAEFC
jgi:hypothetical protein